MQRREKGLRGTLEIYNFISSYLLLTLRDPISIHRQRDSREDALRSSRWSIKDRKLKEGKRRPHPDLHTSPRLPAGPTASSARRSNLWLDGRFRAWKWILLTSPGARQIPNVHVLGVQIGEAWGGERGGGGLGGWRSVQVVAGKRPG